MGKYVLRRLLQMIPVLIGATFLIYAMVFALPGDPTAGKCGDRGCPPAVQAQIADIVAEHEAAKLLVYQAAWLKDQGRPCTKQAAMAKVAATEAAWRAADAAVQIHGGYGYCKEYAVERYYRDVRITRIYEGTSEIQRLVIARQLLAD